MINYISEVGIKEMPHTNIWEPNGLYRKFTGEISGDEILESNFELHAHPDFEYINYIINDFTEITDYSIDTAHAKTYATVDDIISNAKGKLKIAIVVTKPSHVSLANDYREHMNNKVFECEIFQTIEDARKWVSNE